MRKIIGVTMKRFLAILFLMFLLACAGSWFTVKRLQTDQALAVRLSIIPTVKDVNVGVLPSEETPSQTPAQDATTEQPFVLADPAIVGKWVFAVEGMYGDETTST